jgi:hypothetical protein
MIRSILSLAILMSVGANHAQAAERGEYRNWSCFFHRFLELTLTPTCIETNGEGCANFWNEKTGKVTDSTAYQLTEDDDWILVTGARFEMKLDKSTRDVMGDGKTPTFDGTISIRDVFGMTLKDAAVGCNVEIPGDSRPRISAQ